MIATNKVKAQESLRLHWVPGPNKSLLHPSLGLLQAPWLKSDKGPLCCNCQSPLLKRELETSGISWGTDKTLDSCQREHD